MLDEVWVHAIGGTEAIVGDAVTAESEGWTVSIFLPTHLRSRIPGWPWPLPPGRPNASDSAPAS